MAFAVIKTGGKQYVVRAGDKLAIERIPGAFETVTFKEVLLKSDGDKVTVGVPTIQGATVEAAVVKEFRDKKKIVFRFHSKTRYRKLKGHRQPLLEVKITKI